MSFDDLPLARAAADRAAHLRTDPAVLTRALADPRTRVLLVADGSVVTQDSAAGGAAAPSPDGWGHRRATTTTVLGVLDPRTAATIAGHPPGSGSIPTDEDWLLLGSAVTSETADGSALASGTDDADADADADGVPLVLALRVPPAEPAPRTGQSADVLVHQRTNGAPGPAWLALPAGLRWTSLRGGGADLDAADAGLATTAVALDAWHARHVRCPRCGAPTRVVQAGWVRVCTVDGSEHYPRTDPAVIMAVVDDDDRLLLGHAAAWAPGRFSTLAGFVEAGESAEHAVRREVREETAVEVDRVEYRGSQPWPFPASLMLAFRAHAATTLVRTDDEELTDARWFSRATLADAVRAGEVVLPSPASIAHALVEDWYGGALPTSP